MFRSSVRVAVAVVAAALALAAPGLPAQAALTRSDAGSAPNAEQTPVKVMPLGASITFGVGSSTGNGYRENLRQKLQQAGVSIDYVGSQSSGNSTDRENEGHPGWRIDEVANQTDSWMSTYAPDVILLNVGTNDINQDYDLPNAPNRLAALIDKISADRPTAQIMVSTLVPSGDPGRNVKVDAFNADVRTLVAQKGGRVHLVDVNRAVPVSDLTSDKIHPNDAGFAKMADSWFQALRPLLRSGDTTCAADAVCFWQDVQFSGPKITVGVRDLPAGTCVPIADGWNDRASSLVNNTARNVDFYVDANCGGASFTVPVGTEKTALTWSNDRISSYRV